MFGIEFVSRFRRFQILHDLKGVSRRADDHVLHYIASGVPGVEQAQTAITRELRRALDEPALTAVDLSRDAQACLLLAATLPEKQGLAFETATAILLGQRIFDGGGEDDLFWHWDAFAMHYRAADAPVRAALMQGFLLCHDLGLVTLETPPGANDILSEDRVSVTERLLGRARRITMDEVDAIARADNDHDRTRHLEALQTALGASDGVLGPGDAWFPGEVLDRTADLPGSVGYWPSLALLCLNALRDGDSTGQMAHRWASARHQAAGIGDPTGEPIALGLRHLFETTPGWDPYMRWSPQQIEAEGRPLPQLPMT